MSKVLSFDEFKKLRDSGKSVSEISKLGNGGNLSGNSASSFGATKPALGDYTQVANNSGILTFEQFQNAKKSGMSYEEITEASKAAQMEAEKQNTSSGEKYLSDLLASGVSPSSQQYMAAARFYGIDPSAPVAAKASQKAFVDWDGRQALLEEYKRLNNAAYLNPKQNARKAEVLRALQEGDAKAKNPETFYSGSDRFAGTLSGGVKGWAGSQGTFFGKGAEALSRIGEKLGSDTGDYAGWATDELSAAMIGTENDPTKRAYQLAEARAMQEWGRKTSESSENDISRAKEGLGFVGRLAVDLGANAVQMGLDSATAALTGGSGALVPLFTRAAGSGMQEAENNGAGFGKQLLYGSTVGAIEVLTEKMTGGLAKVYGKGTADELVESIVKNFAKSEAGRKALLLLADMGGETIEEIVSDIANPWAKLLYDDGAALKKKFGSWEGFKAALSEEMYDGLVGFLMGSLGATSKAVTGDYGNTANRLGVESTFEQQLREKGYDETSAKDFSRLMAKSFLGEEMSDEQQKSLASMPTAENLLKTAQENPASISQKEADRRAEHDKAVVQSVVNTLDVSSEEADILMDGYDSRASSARDYALGVREAYKLGAMGLSLEQSIANSEYAPKLQPVQFQHAWELGSKQAAEGGSVDVSTEEGRQKLSTALASLGEYAETAAGVYEAGQDVNTYAAAMNKAARLYAANGGDVKAIARDGKTGDIVGTLTDAQLEAASQIGQQMRAQQQAAVEKRDQKIQAIRKKAAEISGVATPEQIAQIEKDISEANTASKTAMDQAKEAMAQLNAMARVNPAIRNTEEYQKAYEETQQKLKQAQEAQREVQRLEQQKSRMKGTKPVKRKKGTVRFDGGNIDGKQYGAVDRKGLSRQQKNIVAMVERLADLINIDYVFFSGPANMGGAYVRGGTVYININAGVTAQASKSIAAASLSHELTHFMQEYAPKEYQDLKDYIVRTILNKSTTEFIKLINQQMRWEPGKSYEEIEDELVANACQTMLMDDKAVTKLARQNMDLAERVADILEDTTTKIKAAFERLDFSGNQGPFAAVRAVVNNMEDISERWSNGISASVENYNAVQTLLNTDPTQIGDIDLKDFEAANGADGKPLFQIYAFENDEPQYREMLEKWGGMSNAEIDRMFNAVDRAMAKIKANLEALDYAWEEDINDRAFQPIKQNSDKLYKVSQDFSTLCRKRLLQGLVAGQLSASLQRGLTKEEGIAVRDALIALQEEGKQIEVACALCYVESARMRSQKAIQEFLNDRSAALQNYFANQKGREAVAAAERAEREAIYKEYGLVRGKGDDATMYDVRDAKKASMSKIPTNLKKRIQDAKKAARKNYALTPAQQQIIETANSLPVESFTTPEGLQDLAKNHREIFNAFVLKVSAASKSKGIENDTWWRAGDSRNVGDALIEQMNAENGLRTQSWSDFQVKHLMDYIAATIEMSTRGAKQHAYTKVIDYVELMGKTGVMINMSLIPTREFNGKLEYDDIEGFVYKEALRLRDKFPDTAGTICIGMEVEQIRQLLESDVIDYVIPYHQSGMSKDTRKAMHIPAWKDFQNYQGEKKLSGAAAKANAAKYGVTLLSESDPKWHEAPAYSEWFDLKAAREIAKQTGKRGKYGVMTGGYEAMRQAAENYKRICAERGLAPKFSYGEADFSGEANYWKLLIDRKMVNNKTGDIIEQKAIKPNFDIDTIDRILNDELDRYGTVKADQEEAIERVTRAFLSGDVKGGMSSEQIAKAMQKPVDNVPITNVTQHAAQLQTFREAAETEPSQEDFNADGEREESKVQYSRFVTDPDTLEFLDKQKESGEVIVTYKTFLEIDGKLYPPIASKQRDDTGAAKMAHAMEVGRWEESVGNPNSRNIISKVNSKGETRWYYRLIKDNGKTVDAAYDPYQHSSDVVLNDQFEEAYKRPNLVTYECIIPKSELSSGYHYRESRSDGAVVEALLPVGKHPWKKGTVAKNLKNTNRSVYLTRWLMPARRMENSEVAQMYKNIMDAEDSPVAIPFNVVPPGLLQELEKLGVPIDYEGSPIYRSHHKSGAQLQTFVGYDEDTGRGIYMSNFPENYPAAEKRKRVIDLVQNVFSKKPIELVVNHEDGTSEVIEAQFDPDFDESGNRQTDLGKLAFGNWKGNKREKRVTLNLADDYYRILHDARYIGSGENYDNPSEINKDVEIWHYFVNQILYMDQGKDEKTPYSVFIDVKKKPDGNYVYTFYALEDKNDGQTTPQLFDATVNSPDNGTADGLPTSIVTESDGKSKAQKWDYTADDTEAEKRGRELAYARIQSENAVLKETVKGLKRLAGKQKTTLGKLQKQLQLTKTPEVRENDAKKLAKALISEAGSDADAGKVATGIKALGDYLLQTPTGEISEDELKNRAKAIASEVLDASTDAVVLEGEALEVNPFEAYMGEAVEDMANRIVMDAMSGVLRPTVPTKADKQQARTQALKDQILELKAENKLEQREAARLYQTIYDLSVQLDKAESRYETLRQEADYRATQIRAEGAARAAEIKARERARANDLLKEQKEHYLEMAERAKERREESAGVTKYRKQVEKQANKLYEMLMTNSNDLHVPEVLKAPLGEFLESLDFSSKRSLAGGTETKADQKFGARLLRLQQMLENQQRYIDGDQNVKSDLGGYIDVSSDMLEYLRNVSEMITTALNVGRDFTINQMSAQDLKTMSQFLANLRTAIKNMNRFMANARYESVREAASADIDRMKELGTASELANSGLVSAIGWENGTPYYIMKRFGEGAKSIFDGFTRGWERLAFNAQEIINFTKNAYTDKEVREWKRDVHDITLEDGSKIQMTTAQIMELSMLLGREQAVKHISKGGIRIGDIKTKKGKRHDTKHYHLSEKDIANITGMLNARQTAVAGALQRYMAAKGAEWGNEVSMRRFGYKFYEEGPGYYPIRTDPNDRPMADTDAQTNSMFRLLNLSSSKSLNPKASNALIVGDIFDTFADHMADMAKLNGMGLPILDAIKWFNYKERIDLDDGTYDTRTLQGAMEEAFGAQAQRYFRTLMKDINGQTESGDRGTSLPTKLMSNYKIAAVAANLRVAFLQPTSYVRAMTVIKPQFLLGVLPSVKAYEEAMKYSGTAVWKSLGYYETDISKSLRGQITHDDTFRDKFAEASMWLAEKGDQLTWSMLWQACKRQAKAENPNAIGETLMQKTAALFREVIYSSQVMDSTLTRSEIMRGKTGWTKAMSAFMAEPTLSYNILMDAFSDLQLDQRKNGNGAWQRNAGKIGKAFTVYVTSAAFSAVVESLADAVRDDDDEEFWEKFKQALWGKDGKWITGNLAQDLTILGKLPYIKNFISKLQGYTSGDMSIAAFSTLVDAYKIWEETIKLSTSAQDKATKITYYGKMTPWGKVYKTLQALSQLSGLAVSNLTRDAIAIWNTAVNGRKDEWKIRTYDPNTLSAASQEAYETYVSSTGLSLAEYKKILAAADVDGTTSPKQDEMGAHLVELLDAGAITEVQAQAVWKSRWNSAGSKTFDKWREGTQPAATEPATPSAVDSWETFKREAPIYSGKREEAYSLWKSKVKPLGVSLDEYTEYLKAADTDSNGSVNQNELGAQLYAAIEAGKMDEATANAIFYTLWNGQRSKTYSMWAKRYRP